MLDVWSLSPFGTRQITIMKVVFGNSGRLPLAFLHTRSPKSIAGRLMPHLPFFLASHNLACTFLEKHLHPLPPNPFNIIEMFHRQPGLESLQKIDNRCLPVHGSIAPLFETVLSPDNRPMLLPKNPSHPDFLPLVERTKVGLPHSFGKLVQA
jgi:hypothetical protein